MRLCTARVGVMPVSYVEFNSDGFNSLLNSSMDSMKEHHKISNIPKFRCEML